MSEKSTTGSYLKAARKKLGLKQHEVAQSAGLHVNTYARYERDELALSLSSAKKLAKVLKLKLDNIPVD